MTQNVATIVSPSVIAAGAAINELINHPLIGAFVGSDHHLDLPLVVDHKDIFEPLVKPEIFNLMKRAHDTVVQFLFDDEHGNFNEQAAAALEATYGYKGEFCANMRYYPGGEMYVIETKIGKLVIG